MADYVRLTLTLRQAEALAKLARSADALATLATSGNLDQDDKLTASGHAAMDKLDSAIARTRKSQNK